MKARPNGFGSGDTLVEIDWDEGITLVFKVGDSDWYTLVGAKQLIANLQAAVDVYEEENGTAAD